MSDDALGEDYSRSAMPGKNKSTASKDIDLFQLDEPKIGKHTIVSVSLSNTKARIWFGVEREGFGPELSTLSPWTVFIERLAEMADSALLRLEREQIQNEAAETRLEMLQMQNEAAETRLEMLQMQNEAAETRSLATYVVTSHTVFHQMQNMVRDLANPISTLNEMADAGVLGVSQEIKDLTDMINKSAEKLLDFASAFMNVKKMDAHRPCTLQEVIAESKELFDVSLKNNRISLDVELPNDLKIDIPFNVAFLAISNLLSNAKDAIGKRGGKIRIEAEAVRDLVYCSVINNGPPVDPEIRKDLFRKIGVSTKQGQTIRGWGLYLAHKSLSENRGHIELTKSDPTETRFTIKFPRVRQEQI
jgi:signal transduction histidine kinase